MRNRLYIILIVFVLVFGGLSVNCGKGKDEQDASHSHEGEDPGAHEHLHIKPEIIKKWGIQYSSPEAREYLEKIVLTGVVKTNEETTFIANAMVCGMVTGIKKDIGDPVKKGDTLCILNSPDLLEHKTDYIKAFQEYRLTKENFERAGKLFKIKAIEKKGFISRETEYKTAMAEYFSLEAELGTTGFSEKNLQTIKEAVINDEAAKLKEFLSPYYYIPSPASGKVMNRNLTLGARVENNSAIFEISDTRKLWVLLDAMEKDLRYIEKGKPVAIVSDIYPGEEFTGNVLVLMEKIDPELRTVKVRVEVDNTGGRLKPEMYVRGKLEKKVKKQYLAISVSALVKVSGVDGVFVIETDGFLFHPVQVVETDSAGFAFVKGLTEEDMVITEGAFYLKAEYEIQRGGGTDPHAGHSH
ncbi:MAG: efflux RND transporter periplasmic adaptor subunit [bacterium]|nr:efflux RND transporter periplasmic adaptor subunit [bacterium]